jgi:hypothetical protein
MLGRLHGHGRVVSTGRWFRVEEACIPGSAWSNRNDHSRLVEIELDEETGEWVERMVVEHWKAEEDRVPYRNVILKSNRELISAEEYERRQRELAEEEERRRLEAERREKFQKEAQAIIANRLNVYVDLVSVSIGRKKEAAGTDEEFFVDSATISKAACEEILAGSYPCETCGQSTDISPYVVDNEGTVMLLCENCKPEEEEAE